MPSRIYTQSFLAILFVISFSSGALSAPEPPQPAAVKDPLTGRIENELSPVNINGAENSLGNNSQGSDRSGDVYSQADNSSLSTDDLQKRAQEFIAGRQFEKAKQSLSALIERSPDNQPAFVKFGEILLKTGHPQDALTFLSIAQALKSDDPRCTKDITLAEGLLSSRPRNFGISNLESFPSLLNDKLSSSFSGNAASIVEKGVRLWTLGCPEQAAYLFKYATKCDHTSAVAYFDLGLYYECKGDLQQALSCYEQASSMAKSRRSLFGWTSEIAKAEADVRAKLGANVQSGNEHLLNATAVEQRFRDSVAAASSSCGGCRLFFLVRTKKLDAT